MPRGKKAESGSAEVPASPVVYVQCSLTVPDQDLCSEFLASLDSKSLLEWLESLVSDGLEVKLRGFNNEFCCLLIDPQRQKNGVAYILTGWSDSPFKAAAVAVYKHSQKLAGNWESNADSLTRMEFR